MTSGFDHDPLEQRTDALFRALERDTEQLVDPLPAARVRALGDRRRTRRRATTAAAGLAAVALVVGGTWTVTRGGGPTNPQAASAPTASARHSISTSTQAPLPTAADTSLAPPMHTASASGVATASPAATAAAPASSGSTGSASPTPSAAAGTPTVQGDLTWDEVADASVLGDGLSQVDRAEDSAAYTHGTSWCSGSLSTLGATSTRMRYLNGPKYSATVFAFDFTTADEATAARGAIRQWFSQCQAKLESLGYTGVAVSKATEVTPAISMTPSQISWRSITGTDPSGEPGYQEQLLLQAGKHLEWIQYLAPGDAVNHTAQSTAGMPGTSKAQAALARLAG